MANFRLLPRNNLDEAIASASPSVLSTLPEQNLQKPERTLTMRSSSRASQAVTFVLPSAITVTVAGIGRQNLQSAGTIRVECFTDTAATAAAAGGDSTALTAFDATGFNALDVARYLTDRFRGLKNFVWYPAAAVVNVRSLKFTFADATNPAGYFEAARAFAGEFFEAAYNPETTGGVGITVDSKTTQRRSEAGSLVSDKMTEWRSHKINPEKIASGADLAAFLAIARDLGKHQDFFFDMYPGTTGAEAAYFRGLYKFTSLGLLEPSAYRFAKQSLTIEEA